MDHKRFLMKIRNRIHLLTERDPEVNKNIINKLRRQERKYLKNEQ